ncbi:MAG: hypothetical protein WCF88_20590 [Candidatus Acidiferrales bacterium]
MARPHACVLMVLFSLMVASAAETPDFSGSYTLTPAKHVSKSVKEVIEALTVVQTVNAIVVTRITDGKPHTNTFPLDGGEGVCYTENHTKGTCKGHLKGNHLFLDAFVTTRPLKDGPLVTLHTKERWELSSDLKILKIHAEIENPELPIQIFDPWTDVYTRN